MPKTKKIASPLSRKATLVQMVVSQWTARKFDKKVTDKINREHAAADDAGRYNKLLIEADRLKRLNCLVSQARTLHYKYTKPWSDGVGILPNTLHAKFAEEFRDLKREFDQAADDFARDYPQFVAERKRALNGLFDPADYPGPDDLRAKFKLQAKLLPVPDVNDFRSDVLDEATIEDIKQELADTLDETQANAMRDTARQIADVVGHMSEKLKAYTGGDDGAKSKNFFTDSLVGNVRQLAELLPHFNLNDDPKLNRVIERIQRELCAEEPAKLREDAKTRASVQKSADQILKDVSALLG